MIQAANVVCYPRCRRCPKENFLEYAMEKDAKNFHFSGWV